MSPSTSRREWAGAVVLLVLGALVGFREFVAGRLSPFFGDIRYTHHALIEAGARREGRWPLWSDSIFNGHPIFADSQAAQYYPPTWVVSAWGDADAYTAFVLFHVVVAGLGMVAWLRGHGFGLPAQLTGALCFAFSGAFLSLAVHLGLFAVLAWCPGWLAALHRVVREPSAGSVSVAGLVLGMLIFAGGPQMLAAAVLLTGFYGVGLFVQHRREWRGRALAERSIGVAATVLVGACVGGIALLPQIEFLPLSHRTVGLELEFASQPALAPHSPWRFVLGPTLPRPASAENNSLELYIGMVSVALVVLGFVGAFGREQRREHAGVAGAMAAFALLTSLASLGAHLPVFGWMVEFVPGFGYFRAPARLVCITGIALAYGCALGLELWIRGALDRRLVAIVAVLVVVVPGIAIAMSTTLGGEAWAAFAVPLVLVGLAALVFGHSRRAIAGWMIVAVTVIDLVCLAAPRSAFARRSRAELPDGESPEALVLQSLDGLDGRVIIGEGYGYGNYNQTMLRGIDGVSGYNGSSLLRFLDVMHMIEVGTFYPRTGLYRDETALTPRKLESPLIGMLGAPYLVTPKVPHLDRYQFVQRFYADRRAELLYRDRDAVPRAYLSYSTIVAPTLAEREAAMLAFDPSRETIVEDPALQLDGPARIDSVAIERLRPEHLILEFESEHPTVLVITDTHYPGWRAIVDGVETPIAVVNHAFRGVLVEPGAHVVELVFRPRSYEIGWRLTVGMLCLSLGGAAWSRWRSHYVRGRSTGRT
jgi:hypothetical protein